MQQKRINSDRIGESFPCNAAARTGQRRKNRPHLKQSKNLRITNSKIPKSGLGLFNACKT